MKLYDRPMIDKTLDRLPELPEGVEVPDDISGLQPPTTLRPTGGAIRWMRWIAAIIVLGAVGLLAVLAINSDVEVARSDGSDYTTVGATPWATTEVTQADVYGSDRHLGTWADLGAGRAFQVSGTASRHLAPLEQMALSRSPWTTWRPTGPTTPAFQREWAPPTGMLRPNC